MNSPVIYRDSDCSFRTFGAIVSVTHAFGGTYPIADYVYASDRKEEPDGSVADAVTALIYAAPHTELKGMRC